MEIIKIISALIIGPIILIDLYKMFREQGLKMRYKLIVLGVLSFLFYCMLIGRSDG